MGLLTSIGATDHDTCSFFNFQILDFFLPRLLSNSCNSCVHTLRSLARYDGAMNVVETIS